MTDDAPGWLAKDCLDIGLFTNNLDEMLSFWQNEIGLTFDHMLPLGGGVRQYRHDFGGAVLKINHARDPLPPRPSAGLVRVLIAQPDTQTERELFDPDGNALLLVPMGHMGLTHWAVEVAASNESEFLGFYEHALGLPKDDGLDCAVSCGKSKIVARLEPDEAAQTQSEPLARAGYRYTTLQVQKVDTIHARVLKNGGREGRAPETLGETARISFVRDGLGNWMELSQRASLTGSLEPG